MNLLTQPWMIGVRNRLRALPGARGLYARLVAGRSYEDRFGRELLAAITPETVLWDVGANVGLYSRKALHAGARHVVCIEPAPAAVATLGDGFAAEAIDATRYTVLPVALSDSSGTARFAADGASVTNRLQSPGAAADATIEVPVRRAEDLLRESQAPPPSVVKVDVEGYELEALRGFGALLNSPRLRAVFVEVHFSLLHERGMDSAPTDIETLLRGAGFAVRWLDLSHLCALRAAPPPSAFESRR